MRNAIWFIAAVVLVDQAIGLGLGALYRRCTTGENGGLINYALRQDADLLVLGSSRAQHHVVPTILSSKLGLRAFNAGIDGQDFLYAMMLFHVWTSIHGAPKVVVLEVDPLTFQRSPDELQRTSVFSPFVRTDAEVRRILVLRGPFERLKLLSGAYRYNGKVLAILKNLFVRPSPSFDGYVGLDPAQRTDDGRRPIDSPIRLPDLHMPFWDLKLALFDSLSTFSSDHGTRLFLVHSPHYGEVARRERRWRAQMRLLIAHHPGAEFIDGDALFARFADQPDLFVDSLHLNDRGARIFSTLLADELARRLTPPRVGAQTPKGTLAPLPAGATLDSVPLRVKKSKTGDAGAKNGTG